MSVQRQIGFWLAALVVVALTLYLLREVLLPFVAGMALAYMLDPIVDWLERLGLGRLSATILILALFVLTFVLALVVLIPLVAHQLAGFGANLPAYVERIQALIIEQSGPVIEKLGGGGPWPTCGSRSAVLSGRAQPGWPGSCTACGRVGRPSSPCSRFSW